MIRKPLLVLVSTIFAFSPILAGDAPPPVAKLSAAEIVDKNVAARGGLQAWRSVHTMSMSGTIGVGGNQRAALATPTPGRKGEKPIGPNRPVEEVRLPFTMRMARTRKQRIELQFKGETAIQVFDGTNGWKLRPYLGRRVVESFTDEEIKSTSSQADLDGPLVDYAAKGTKIEFVGTDKVEGHDAYKVKLTLKTGDSVNVWIDAQTFLESKIEGQPRRLDGVYHPVEVYFRDYRIVNGLQIPFVLETKVLPAASPLRGFRDTPVPPEQTIFEKVEVNPKLDPSIFSKPEVLQSQVR